MLNTLFFKCGHLSQCLSCKYILDIEQLRKARKNCCQLTFTTVYSVPNPVEQGCWQALCWEDWGRGRKS